MAAPSKTQGTQVLAWTSVATANSNVGSAQDVSTKFEATFFVKLGRDSSTAFTAGWPNVRIEGSGKSSADDWWVPLAQFQMAVGASIASTTLNGAISAGATTCVVTSATNIAVGDVLYLGHTSDSTKYELVRVKTISGTTVTFEEACTYAHDNGAKVTDQAEMYVAGINLMSVGRVRVVVDNASGGQTVYASVYMVTGDSIA